MLPLAAAGYHVIAPDQRGYGRTTGWDGSYDADGDPFRILNMVRDATGLVYALGYKSVAGIAGHDAGSPVASLVRADPARHLHQARDHELAVSGAAGDPVQHRQRRRDAETRSAPTTSSMPSSRSCRVRANIITTTSALRGANDDMLHAPQGLHAFFRAYYHYKSADWKENKPHPLKSRTAEEMAKIPTYYVMDRDKGMAGDGRAVHAVAGGDRGLPMAHRRRGGRVRHGIRTNAIHRRAAGLPVAPRHTIRGPLPSCAPSPAAPSTSRRASSPARATGARTRRRARSRRCRAPVCTQWRGTHFVDGAGHWVQQEQPEKTSKLLLEFFGGPR